MPKKLTLAELELTAHRMAPDWWDLLTDAERADLVDRYNELQAAERCGAP